MKNIILLFLIGIYGMMPGQAKAPDGPPASQTGTASYSEPVLVLKPNQPNPFGDQTTIRFQLNKSEEVTITLYNVLGAKVATLLKESLEPGDHNYLFKRPSDLPDGMYIYTVETPSVSRSQRMIIKR